MRISMFIIDEKYFKCNLSPAGTNKVHIDVQLQSLFINNALFWCGNGCIILYLIRDYNHFSRQPN